MKKGIFIIGIILIIAAVIFLGLSVWYNRLGGMVMDAEGNFYARTGMLRDLFQKLSIGSFIAGAVALVIRFMAFKNK